MSTLQFPRVPGPSDLTSDGVARALRGDPVAFTADLVRAYGDFVRLPFGDRELYVLNRPGFVREMFVGNPAAFAKKKDGSAEREYLSQIANFVELFEKDLVASYAPSIVHAARRAHERWQTHHLISGPFEVDIYREIGRITLEVVIQTLFHADAQDDAARLFEAMLAMDAGYGFDPIEATLGIFMPEAGRKLKPSSQQARAQIQSYIEGLVRVTHRDIERENAPKSFLAVLIRYMGAEQAAAAAMSIMFSMHEVTATTLPWACYSLAQNPDADRELDAELSTVLNLRYPGREDLPALVYTSMVLAEARRLYPVVWIVGRFVREDVRFDRYRVSAGSIVMASQQIMHRDPRYFPDPDRFDPSRWTSEALALRPEFSYFPFSAGPRACAGEAFAKIMDPLILATLAQHWRGRVTPGRTPRAEPSKSSAPRQGLRMILEPRRNDRKARS